LTKTECQRRLDAGCTLEGNGFRIYMNGKTLVVQNLLQVWWREFHTYPLRATKQRAASRGITGKRAALAGDVADVLDDAQLEAWGEGTIETGALAAALLEGPGYHPTAASPLIPAVEDLRGRAFGSRWVPADDQLVREIALATTALALVGGEADEEELVEAMAQMGHNSIAARGALRAARGRSTIWCRDWRSPVPTYFLQKATS
jgi:hypothetical protein